MHSLAQLLTATASEHADRPALKLDDTVVTYAVLNEGATRIAGLLKEKGVQPGDRVGIMLPNVPYFGIVYYGILRAGGVVVPMNVLLKGREVAFYLDATPAPSSSSPRRVRRGRRDRREQAGAQAILVKPGEFEQLHGLTRRVPRGRGRASRGHRRHPLHVRHDRHAEGRRAHPREPASRTAR